MTEETNEFGPMVDPSAPIIDPFDSYLEKKKPREEKQEEPKIEEPEPQFDIESEPEPEIVRGPEVETKSRLTLSQDKYPTSPEIEANTLGLILNDPTILDTIDESLKPEYFTGDRFLIASSIVDIVDSGRLPDLPSVGQDLEEKFKSRFEQMGGRAHLLDLLTSVPYSTVSIGQYIEKLKEDHTYRRLIDFGEQSSNMGMTRFGESPTEAIGRIQDELLSISDRSYRNDSFQKFDDVIDDLTDALLERAEAEGDLVGVSSPWRDLDRYTFGFQDGDLVVIAARPGVGKSTFGVNLCAHTALRLGIPTALFSLEMTNKDLMKRFVSSETMIPFSRIQKGDLSESEWAKISKFNNEFHSAPLYLDDSSSTNLTDIRNKMAKIKAIHGKVGIVVVDYIGLLTNSGKHSNESRQQEVSEISRGLKILAKDFDCPVVALSQLNRGVENREDKRPRLSDIRDSGAVEQDAGFLAALYSDSLYYPGTANENIIECIILKNRHGSLDTVRFAFMNNFSKFMSIA